MLPGAYDGRPDVTDVPVMDNHEALPLPGVGVLPTRPGWPRVISFYYFQLSHFIVFCSDQSVSLFSLDFLKILLPLRHFRMSLQILLVTVGYLAEDLCTCPRCGQVTFSN